MSTSSARVRGLYRLAGVSEAEYPDLAVVAARAPNAAVCLISALSYHGITTQIPSSVHLAVPRGSYHRVKLATPVTMYRFDPKTFAAGLETQEVGGMPVKIYSPARTVVDCFKFRNKLGLDVALEALRLARERKRVQNRELLRFAFEPSGEREALWIAPLPASPTLTPSTCA